MFFEPEVDVLNLLYYLRRFVGLLNHHKFMAHLKRLESHTHTIVGKEYLKKRHSLELALGEIIQYKSQTHRILWPCETQCQYQMYSFMTMIVKVFDRLSPAGKRRLQGELLKSLNQTHGFSPLAFEMKVAGHLLSAGFDVDFCDLENKSKHDLLAKKNHDTIEIECKFISDDIGKKIHNKKFHDLIAQLEIRLKDLPLNGGHFIDLKIPNRLSNEDFQEIIDLVLGLLTKTKNQNLNSKYNVRMNILPLEQITDSADGMEYVRNVKTYTEATFGELGGEQVIIGRRPDFLLVFNISSVLEDNVLDSIYRKHLKSASAQLSGAYPGVVLIFFPHLKNEEFLQVVQGDTGLTQTIAKILANKPNLYGVGVLGEGELVNNKSTLLGIPSRTKESGPCCTFKNPNCSLGQIPENLFHVMFGAAQ